MADQIEPAGLASPAPALQRWLARCGIAAIVLAFLWDLAAKAQPASCIGPDPVTALCRDMNRPGADCGENCCSFAATDRRAALIIGNDHYEERLFSLHNAANDACALAAELKAQSFDKVCCLLNAKITHLSGAIASSTNHLGVLDRTVPKLKWQNTRFLMYFAGHGAQVSPPTPQDPPKETVIYASGIYRSLPADLDNNFVSVNVVRDDWNRFKNVAPVIVVDACRTKLDLPRQFAQTPIPVGATFITAAADARAPTIPSPSRREPPAGYVVMYSTKGGAPAIDIPAGASASQPGRGRFMRYFAEEIGTWGRTLDDVFEAVKSKVEEEARTTVPADGQRPDKLTDGPSYTGATWRYREDDACSQAMTAVGYATTVSEFGLKRCPGRTFAECLRGRTPSDRECDVRNTQAMNAARIDARSMAAGRTSRCLDMMNETFKDLFGASGEGCPDAPPQAIARVENFVPAIQDLPTARVNNLALNASRTYTALAPDLAPEDRAEIRTRRGQPSGASRTRPSRFEMLPVDCSSPGSNCGGGMITLRRANGDLQPVRRSDVRVHSAARATIKVRWDERNDVPQDASAEELGAAAAAFANQPDGIIRITAEVASGSASETSIAIAQQRRANLALLLRGLGLKTQKIVDEIAPLAPGLTPATLHVEFFAPPKSDGGSLNNEN